MFTIKSMKRSEVDNEYDWQVAQKLIIELLKYLLCRSSCCIWSPFSHILIFLSFPPFPPLSYNNLLKTISYFWFVISWSHASILSQISYGRNKNWTELFWVCRALIPARWCYTVGSAVLREIMAAMTLSLL